MSRAGLERAMSGTPLLHDVPEGAVHDLAALGTVREYRKQTYLFHEGDPSDAMLFLLHGRIEVSVLSETGHRQLLATLETPQFFGELGVLGGRGRTATALALEASSVWVASADRFMGFLADHFEATLALLAGLARQIQEHEAFVEDLLRLDLKGRVAKRLLLMATPSLDPMPDDGVTVRAATHADLAAMCGGSRENVTRVLSELQRRGFVRRDRGHYVLERVDDLRRLANV
jgi:CRP-like cAMP-binding protein